MSSLPSKSGVHPLLAKYLVQLTTHPLRTKCVTSGTLSFLQEILGSNFAGVPIQRPSRDASFVSQILARARVDSKALKMAAYGFLVSAPLGHVLIGTLQRAFIGKTSAKAKIAQILASNLLVAPIQTTVFLTSMAVINGAKSVEEVVNTIRTGFFSVIRVTWVISPLSLIIAQNYIPINLWVPFFNAIQFVLGTYFNTKVKTLKMASQKKKDKDAEE